MVDPTPALNRLVTVLQGLSGMQHVYTGAPESVDSRVNVYVTLDAWRTMDKQPGVVQHAIDYAVTFAYRVAGAEAGIETSMATRAGAFVAALLAERRTQLAGTVVSLGLPDFSRASEPQYAVIAGAEYRLYPGIVPTVQQETF